jgi:hypothetical protein
MEQATQGEAASTTETEKSTLAIEFKTPIGKSRKRKSAASQEVLE